MPVTVTGLEELRYKFEHFSDKIHDEFVTSMHKVALAVESKTKSKLNGEVLNAVSGALRASITSEVIDEGTTITARIFSSGDVKYAGAHEYGTLIHHPGGTAYIPGKGEAMAFVSNTKAAAMDMILPRTRPHDILMPERSFLRSSLSELSDYIFAELDAAMERGLR